MPASPDPCPFVIMVVPGDQFLAAALRVNPDLASYGVSKKVILNTPASLTATLRAVANGWQQYQMTAAAAVKQAGDEMPKRLQTFLGHYADVGKSLEKAIGSYNSSITSCDSRIVPQGRKFAQLMEKEEAKLSLPASIEAQARQSRYSAENEAAKETETDRQLAAD